jgi:hypothetical protein
LLFGSLFAEFAPAFSVVALHTRGFDLRLGSD